MAINFGLGREGIGREGMLVREGTRVYSKLNNHSICIIMIMIIKFLHPPYRYRVRVSLSLVVDASAKKGISNIKTKIFRKLRLQMYKVGFRKNQCEEGRDATQTQKGCQIVCGSDAHVLQCVVSFVAPSCVVWCCVG
jgi:hypothetical protein